MKNEFSAGAVVFRRFGKEIKYLILQSKKWKTWGFPKGHVSEKETEEVTALREIKEETGLSGNLITGFRERHSYEFESNSEKINKTVTFFIMESDQEIVNLAKEELCDFKWSSYEEAMTLFQHESNKNLLTKTQEFLTKNGK